uniref:Syndecan/Neurexin domain-containing protein n=1 Tax=Oryzias latipes TaxID=8090 RepID=A0A3P9J4V1_ORYLA
MFLSLLEVSVDYSHFHPLRKVHHHLSLQIPFLHTKPAHHLLITSIALTNMAIKVCSNTTHIKFILGFNQMPAQTRKTKTFMDLFVYKWKHQNGAEQGAGGVNGLLFIIFVILLLVCRTMKMNEGSYDSFNHFLTLPSSNSFWKTVT